MERINESGLSESEKKGAKPVELEKEGVELELVIEALMGVLDADRDLYLKYPDIQDEWNEADMQALAGEDRKATHERLIGFINKLSNLKEQERLAKAG